MGGARARRLEMSGKAPKKGPAQPSGPPVVLGAVVVGAIFALGLLGRQVADYLADGAPEVLEKHPHLQQDDLISALGSVAMLAFLGFVAYVTMRKANVKP